MRTLIAAVVIGAALGLFVLAAQPTEAGWHKEVGQCHPCVVEKIHKEI